MHVNYPTSITASKFSLAPCDPEQPLDLQVRTWSSVFSDGGSVGIHAYTADGKRTAIDFGSASVEDADEAREFVAYFQDMVDHFNRDLEANWRELITSARAGVADFYEKQAVQYREKADAVARGDWSVA